ncbi:MAG: PAS domain S-box protein [bacterium]
MSIRYKYLLLFPLTALLPVLIFYYFTNHYITDALVSIQRNRISRDIQTVLSSIAAESRQLQSDAESLTYWSHIYNLLIQKDVPPQRSEFSVRISTLEGNPSVALVTADGETVSVSGQFGSGEARMIANSVPAPQGNVARAGLALLEGRPAIVAVSNLLRDDGTGPPKGRFVVARRIDGRLAGAWQTLLQSQLAIFCAGRAVIIPESSMLQPDVPMGLWSKIMGEFGAGEKTYWVNSDDELDQRAFVPLTDIGGNIIGAIQLTAPPESLLPVKTTLDRTSIIIFSVAALLATILAFILSFYIVGRITSLNLATKNLLSGEGLPKVATSSFMRDELDELLLSFKRMKEELDTYLQQLIFSEVKYKRVVNSSISGIFVYGKGQYLFCNPQFESISEYTMDELNKISPLAYIHPDDIESFVESIVFQIAKIPVEMSEDTRIITKSGKEKILNFRVEFIEYKGETCLLAHVTDVTAQRQLERQLFQAQKLESVGTLAGGIAHDFNNILGGVIGLAEMIEERYPNDSRLMEITQRILNLGRRANRMVKHLLTFARGEVVSKEEIDVTEAIDRTLEIFVLPKSMDITVETDYIATGARLLFNPIQFDQMMVNLLVNARDAMPDGGKIKITVDRIKPADPASGPNLIEIKVADNGIGMPQEHLDRIYDPFFTTKSVGKGTGLGLAVVYGVVETHGGTVSVESRKNEGTTFTLHFPEAVEAVSVESRG